MEKEKQQEFVFKLSMFEQQMNQLQEQMEAVEKGINDLSSLNFSLDDIKNGVGKEVLSPLGKGIFVKANLVSDDLTVDIGQGNFVKKTIPEIKEIIKEQTKKLISVKKELDENLERINREMTKTLEEFRKASE
ncbi:MAG: prefoldin subunit alpha [Candidatus Pacearchaeota archaeon]|jgi:prefoldin alpha subunit